MGPCYRENAKQISDLTSHTFDSMIIEESNLHIKRPRSRIATIEVDVFSLETQDEPFPKVIQRVLNRLAKDERKPCFSVYTYITQSYNFREPTTSILIGATGGQKILEPLLMYFRSIKGVRARAGEYINPRQALLEYHIEDGHVWKPYEEGFWWHQDENESDTHIRETREYRKESQEITSLSDLPRLSRETVDKSKIRDIKQKIEEVFDLPHGCVVLVKPDRRRIRSDATIGTLRSHWDYADDDGST